MNVHSRLFNLTDGIHLFLACLAREQQSRKKGIITCVAEATKLVLVGRNIVYLLSYHSELFTGFLVDFDVETLRRSMIWDWVYVNQGALHSEPFTPEMSGATKFPTYPRIQ
jgi:hypothetical protein